MSKRGPTETPGASSGPSSKKARSDHVMEMGPVGGQEEFDIKVRACTATRVFATVP